MKRLAWAIVALAAPALGGRLPDVEDVWREGRTANFVLLSQAGERKTLEIARELETFRALVVQRGGKSFGRAAVPTEVIVFDSDDAYRPYKRLVNGKPGNVAGYFLRHDDGVWVTLSSAWNDDPRPLVYHELHHAWAAQGGGPLPVWLSEGLAELYSSITIGKKEATFGRPIESHVRLLGEIGLMPLPELLAVGHDSDAYHQPGEQGRFYAQSWLLTHFLVFEHPAGREGIGRFVAALEKGTDAVVAFGDVFQMTPETAGERLLAYSRSRAFAFSKIPLEGLEVPPAPQLRTASRGRVLFALGNLLAHLGRERAVEAEEHFRAALDVDPTSTEAWAGLAFLALERGESATAATLAEKAAGSASAWAHLIRGRAQFEPLLGRTFAAGEPAVLATARAARQALTRAVELDPGFAEAQYLLGKTYFVEADDAVDGGISALESALRLLPARTDVATELIGLLARRGRKERAHDVLRQHVLASGDPEAIAAAQESLVAADLGKARGLIDGGQLTEAIALLEALEAATRESAFRDLVRSQVLESLEVAKGNRAVGLFNQAVELANQQDAEGALKLFRQVQAQAEDPVLREEAKGRIEYLEGWLARKKKKTKTKPG